MMCPSCDGVVGHWDTIKNVTWFKCAYGCKCGTTVNSSDRFTFVPLGADCDYDEEFILLEVPLANSSLGVVIAHINQTTIEFPRNYIVQ